MLKGIFGRPDALAGVEAGEGCADLADLLEAKANERPPRTVNYHPEGWAAPMIFEANGPILCVHGDCIAPATMQNARMQHFCAAHFQHEEYTREQLQADIAASP